MRRRHLASNERASARSTIGRSPLFSSLPLAEFESLVARIQVTDLGENETLFGQQQPAEEFFWVESGKIKLAVTSLEGHEKTIDIVSAGRTFAEAIMFDQRPHYPVEATSILPSRVWCINVSQYARILRASTDACFAVMAQMSRRLHWQLAEIDRLTLHNATYRVVCYLLDQIPLEDITQHSSELELDIPKHIIASRLSITPETLSRTFSKLIAANYIEIIDSRILLKDIVELRKYVHIDSPVSRPCESISGAPINVAGLRHRR